MKSWALAPILLACGGQTVSGSPTDASVDPDQGQARDSAAADASDSAIPPTRGTSCRGTPGADSKCGFDQDDCCTTLSVPGGSFLRYYDGLIGTHKDYPATVSSFYLDKYLVTVGRFRSFVEAYPASQPKAGDGAHPKIPGSGWDASWPVPKDITALRAELLQPQLACRDGKGVDVRTWTDSPNTNENLPISCVSWYLLFAFCAWDRARLPTDAEWGFAAAGGAEQRVYPWSNEMSYADIDSTRAVFQYFTPPYPTGPSAVGSKPAGAARWGHRDLVGNVNEVTVDRVGKPAVPCTDCANLGSPTNGVDARGGSWMEDHNSLLVIDKGAASVDIGAGYVGVRCAR